MSGFAYLAASVLFIMALRGLSSPESARQGNMYGIAGMVIAIVTTLVSLGTIPLWLRAGAAFIGLDFAAE